MHKVDGFVYDWPQNGGAQWKLHVTSYVMEIWS